MVVLVGFWRHEGFDEVHVTINSLVYYLLSHDCVEYNIEFDDNFFQMVGLISFLLSHKEPVLFFQDVLDLADDVRSPNDFPVLL